MSLLAIHSLLRWAVVILGFWTVLNALVGFFGKKEFSRHDNLSNLLFMISCDIQLLVGLILYFINNWLGLMQTTPAVVMKNPGLRFFAVEHGVMMILAWVLVHVGRVAIKKTMNDRIKHKRMLLFFGLALVIILAAVPWPFRGAAGRPWLPF